MRRHSFPSAFIAFVVCTAFAIVATLLVMHGSDDQRHHVIVLGKRVALTTNESLGHQVFTEHCAGCHQLAASHSVGSSGPDLDMLHPSFSQVENSVENGEVGTVGVMPAGLATGPDLAAVAAYVSRVANPRAAPH